jgi:hypothetical protein
MGTDGHKLSPPTYILVQFILQINEGRVGLRCELDVPQDSASKIRPDPFDLNAQVYESGRRNTSGRANLGTACNR